MALNLDQIRALAQRVAASHGLDVVEVEYQGAGKQRALRIFIEKNAEGRARLLAAAEASPSDGDEVARPEGFNREHLSGITHDDCTAFSRDFGTVLDVEELIPGAEYTLEVSSPGLDRKLSSAVDYERFAGSLVKLQTFEPVNGNRHWQGRLTGVADGRITVDLSALKPKGKAKKAQTASGETLEIALANVEKARLIPEF
ncbi:ribosome maturation factor RimP [Silvibacterium dinghuense]|uniref:Ribosome maturation factor RimP n=1 Tax=Silvibacterium dinghuense TaxID=1560006 RepID=A0A4Q1SIC1_9BACT|nr:ribosome maturation factor RimP [Silvibacterium dinghuense]RXS97346.1 ribosome maturation factor RimP [Silvibacterium dinghuense]